MELKIGDIIKQRREELGLTQEEVCKGICTQKTMSRIETNKNIPSIFIMENIMQRLAIPIKNNYYLLLNHDINIYYLQEQIDYYTSIWENDKAKDLLYELEKLSNKDDMLEQQFIFSKKAIIEDLSDIERIQMLTESIKFTIPNFDIESINFKLITLEECKIIVNIANIYSNINMEKSIKIYSDLLNISQRNFSDLKDYAYINGLISCFLSKRLYLTEKYEDSISVSNIGIDALVKSNKSHLIGEILLYKGLSFLKLGNEIEGKKILTQSFAFMEIMKSYDDLDSARKYLKEEFNLSMFD